MTKGERTKSRTGLDSQDQKTSKTKKKNKRKKQNEEEVVQDPGVVVNSNDSDHAASTVATAGSSSSTLQQDNRARSESSTRRRSLSGFFRRSGESSKRSRSVSSDRPKSKSRDRKKRDRSLDFDMEPDLNGASGYEGIDPVLYPRERLRRMTVREALVDSRVRGRSPNRGLARLEKKVLTQNEMARSSLSSSLPHIPQFSEVSDSAEVFPEENMDVSSGTSTLPKTKNRGLSADRGSFKVAKENDLISPVVGDSTRYVNYLPLDKRKYLIDRDNSRSSNSDKSPIHSINDNHPLPSESTPSFIESEKARRESFSQFLQLRDKMPPRSTSSLSLGKYSDVHPEDYRATLSAIQEPLSSRQQNTEKPINNWSDDNSVKDSQEETVPNENNNLNIVSGELRNTDIAQDISDLGADGVVTDKEGDIKAADLGTKRPEKISKRLFGKPKHLKKDKKITKDKDITKQSKSNSVSDDIKQPVPEIQDGNKVSSQGQSGDNKTISPITSKTLTPEQSVLPTSRRSSYVSPRRFSRTSKNSQTSNSSDAERQGLPDGNSEYQSGPVFEEPVAVLNEPLKYQRRYSRPSERERKRSTQAVTDGDSRKNSETSSTFVSVEQNETLYGQIHSIENGDSQKSVTEEIKPESDIISYAESSTQPEALAQEYETTTTQSILMPSQSHASQKKDRKRSFQFGNALRVTEITRRASEPAVRSENCKASQTDEPSPLSTSHSVITASPSETTVDADCQTDSIELPPEATKKEVLRSIIKSFSSSAMEEMAREISGNADNYFESEQKNKHTEPQVIEITSEISPKPSEGEIVAENDSSSLRTNEANDMDETIEVLETGETEKDTDKKNNKATEKQHRRSKSKSKKKGKGGILKKQTKDTEEPKITSKGSLKKASSLSDLTNRSSKPIETKLKRRKTAIPKRSHSEENITKLDKTLSESALAQGKKAKRKTAKLEKESKEDIAEKQGSKPAAKLTLTGVVTLKQRLARIRKRKRAAEESKADQQEAYESAKNSEAPKSTDDAEGDFSESNTDVVRFENELNISLGKLADSQETEIIEDELIDVTGKPDQLYVKKLHFDPYARDSISELTEEDLIRQRQRNTRLCSRRESKVRQRQKKVISCCKKFITFLFSHIGLCSLVVAYCIFGGFIFKELEGKEELRKKAIIAELRADTLNSIWNLAFNISLNKATKSNFNTYVDEILKNYSIRIQKETKESGWDGKDVSDVPEQWSFPSSLLYAITVMTTIGYGHVAPKTDYGRIVTIAYAVLGIPLTLLCLTNIGDVMAHGFRMLYGKVCCGVCCVLFRPSRRKLPDPEKGLPHGEERIVVQEEEKSTERIQVPTSLCILLMASYVLLGTLMFSEWEGWDFITGTYFCFITLSTIGFGDVVPGTDTDNWDTNEKLVLCAMYLIFGLSLIAMCFNLVQEDVKEKCRRLGTRLGIIEKPAAPV